MSTRMELVAALRERYEESSKAERSVVLNEFAAVTGYHRKHAIRLLNGFEIHDSADGSTEYRHAFRCCRRPLIFLAHLADLGCSWLAELSSRRLGLSPPTAAPTALHL